MWLSDTSIRQPVFITMVVMAVVVVGALFYSRMGLDLYPDISFPLVAVRAVYPGASPEEVETQVTKPLEEALSGLNRVETVRSTSSEGISLVIVEFELEYSAKSAAEDVRERLAATRSNLPQDIYEPVVLRFDPSQAPILIFAVADKRGVLSPRQLRELADDEIKPRLERLPGVAAVDVSGGHEREIRVDLNLNRLQALGLAPAQAVAAIKAENLNVPGGRLTEGRQERLLRTTGEFRTLAEIEAVPITNLRGATVYVRDIATVSDGFKERRAFNRMNERESVALAIRKQSGTNTVQVAEGVKGELKKLEGERPELDFALAIDDSVFIRDANNDLMRALVLGAILAGLVVLFFFRDLRNTLVTVAGLPMIVVGAFGAIHLLGFTINMVTLMALSLAIGFLIDDAIVVRENIFRHMEAGKQPKAAASEATGEIALAVMAMTFAVVAVFFPIVFTAGIAGKFLREFGLTVTIALLISLVEAFTFAPMLSAYFLKSLGREEGRRYGGLYAGYGGVLAWALRRRLVVVALAVAIFAGSLGLRPFIGQTFMPEMDWGVFRIALEMPPGASLAQTDQAAREVEEVLLRQPEVAHVFASVGSADGAVDKATFYIKMKQRGYIQKVEERIRPSLAAIPGGRLSVQKQQVGTGVAGTVAAGALIGQPILINIQGARFDDLDRASQQVLDILNRIPGVVDADRSFKPGRPEVQAVVDRARAADLGVSTAQIGATVRTLVNGEVASRYREDAKEIDIRVQLREEDRSKYQDILSLPLTTARGTQVPLHTVAQVALAAGPTQVDRQDRQRQVVVGAGYLGRPLGDITNETKAALASLPLPEGVSYQFAGLTKRQEESFTALYQALGLAVLFIYMVLASQFGSLIHPLTIMLALPLAVVGALVALLITGIPLGMQALIGIIMLMGLVTKNSILLVDFTNRLRRQGMPRDEAILTAGPIRLRPILMTTMAMIGGMLPAATGIGAASEFRQAMAVPVIGGLITSSLLTLVVVPVAYSLIDDLGRLLRRAPAEEVAVAEASAPAVKELVDRR